MLVYDLWCRVKEIFGILCIFSKTRKMDFKKFINEHGEYLKDAKQTKDHSRVVCHYYKVMADWITMACGPHWHFVPKSNKMGRIECCEEFNKSTMVRYLNAKIGDDILEVGAGFGECGRRVALYSGANMTSLTMAKNEVIEGNKRNKTLGLHKRCKMLQGDYHHLPQKTNTLDAVFGVYCLKYSSNLEKVMAEIFRVLKPGGKFVSYEILTSDKFDAANCEHQAVVNCISDSTGMPHLWSANDFRLAANKIGFVNAFQQDITDKRKGDLPWYQNFKDMMPLLKFISAFGYFAETFGICNQGFSEFLTKFMADPCISFLKAADMDIITCTLMMTWTKPLLK